jgi:GT2 family glycosyltransferase
MPARLTASIVIYKNNVSLLEQAVRSFLDSTTESILYLIDNSPMPNWPGEFNDTRIRYIFNNRNVGFGAGHNIAINHTLNTGESEYHIVLNPDVYFDKEVIPKLLTYMESNQDVGLVMPKVLFPDGRLQPVCKLLPTPGTLFTRRFLKFNTSLLNEINHWYEMHFTGYDKIMDVPFLSGCFMFLRTESLRRVGLFDERIFLYTEDTDLSRRLHKQYRTIFFPDAVIYHHHEKASHKNNSALLHHMRSTITYFNKWGWFNDAERKVINQQVLLKLSE